MDIVIGSDSNFFPGLLSTVASLVWHEKQQPLQIHVLDGGLKPEQWTILTTRVKALNAKAGLVRHEFDPSSLCGLTEHGELGLMTYARVFIPQLIQVPAVVYVDADFLVTRPVSGLLPFLDSNHALCGATDYGGDLLKDCPWGEGTDLSSFTYVNCGLLVMNLEKWRQEKLSEKLLEFLNTESARCRHADQSAINWVLKDHIGVLPPEWNIMANAFDAEGGGYAPGTVNLHYASGMKPWKRPLPTLSHRLWWQFARRFAPEACRPNPFWKPRNALRYVRHQLGKSPRPAGYSMKAWEQFWNKPDNI
jgi:lipopolysaccharide biosynthesis glycosyltransferase